MTVSVEIDLAVVECANCSIPFGIPERLQKSLRRSHATFYCPHGHNNWYPQKSDEEKLRANLDIARDRAARERALRDQAEASLRATRGVVTRQKNKLERVHAGVCPDCNRSFRDLARHMKSKHS